MNVLYFIEADFGRIGRAFIETDRDQNSRAHVIGLIRSGEVKPVKVLEVCEDEGTCRDVTELFRDLVAVDIINDEIEADRQAARFDHQHDTRKNYVEA